MQKHRKLICSLLIILTVFCSVLIPIPTQAAEIVSNDCLYYIKNKRSGKYLTVINNNIVQYKLKRTENQRFYIRDAFTSNGKTYYHIVSDNGTNRRFDVDNAVAANYQNIKLYEETSYADAQWFYFELNPDNSYKILTKLSLNYALDIADASNQNNANVQLFTKRTYGTEYADAQEFYLYKASNSICSWDLVDSSKHLDYEAASAYSNYCNSAKNTWNGYKAGVVRKSTASDNTDVVVQNGINMGAGIIASTNSNGYIYINSTTFDSLSSNGKTNCLIHEFGHALRMGHIWQTTNVMYYANNEALSLNHYNEVSYDSAYDLY